jgi:hypothetical protein
MAELTDHLEEMEPPPPPQTHAVSNRSFATVFDVPLFAQLDDTQRACFSTGSEIRLKIVRSAFQARHKSSIDSPEKAKRVARVRRACVCAVKMKG